MAPATGTGLGSPKAAFRTHLNYLRCMRRLLSSADLSLSVTGTPPRRNHEVSRFRKLLDLTRKSIQADITLARADPTFAVVVTPWFPVKCYYSLYYLESILIHLIDGSTSGFGKGGHAGVRKSLCRLIGSGVVSLGTAQLNRSYKLTEVQALPAIASGRNTHPDYWREAQCVDSLAKKLMEYKLHDAKLGKHWNLHKLKHRAEQAEYIQRESLILLDFFYWYRIKANYRDLDYIDFESGIDHRDILDYLDTYFDCHRHYTRQLAKGITMLLSRPKR